MLMQSRMMFQSPQNVCGALQQNGVEAFHKQLKQMGISFQNPPKNWKKNLKLLHTGVWKPRVPR